MLPAHDQIALANIVPMPPKLAAQEFEFYADLAPYFGSAMRNFSFCDTVRKSLLDGINGKPKLLTQWAKQEYNALFVDWRVSQTIDHDFIPLCPSVNSHLASNTRRSLVPAG